MAVHFHPLTIKDIRRETAECVSLLFDVPETLRPLFNFAHGQNITLKAMIDGEEQRRSYSICTSALDQELRVAIKLINGGKFSTFANSHLKIGDQLEVMPPTGRFNTPLDQNNAKKYVAFAAGSGITPILSIIKTTLQTEPKSFFTLIYGNRSLQSIIFFEELEALKNKYPQRFNLVHLLSREKTDTTLSYGKINNEKLEALLKLINYSGTDEFFICGPESMIFCVKAFLENKKVPNHKIHFELFSSATQYQTSINNGSDEEVNIGKSHITVTLDGRSFQFDLAYNSESILEAALKEGADLPFACKGGVCCTCRSKLLSGKVDMKVNYALEQEEVEQGFILTCQSRPLTEVVEIDFDVR